MNPATHWRFLAMVLKTAGLTVGGCCCLAVGARHLWRVILARRRLRELLGAAAGQDARIVITGATSGIGLELACQLSRHPAVSLLLGCRDTARGERLFRCSSDQRRLFGGGKTEASSSSRPQPPTRVVLLDLLNPDSVQNFSDEAHDFLTTGAPGLRMLINNAAIMLPPNDQPAKGPGPTWQTNFLGPFLLTEMLAHRRGSLTGNATPEPLRVVHVSSRLEKRSALDEALLKEVQTGNTGKHAYSDSKRALMLWTSVRAQNLAFKGSTWCHVATPGMVDTQLGRHMAGRWLYPLTKPLRALLLRSAAEGALSVVAAGLMPKATESFGFYYDGEKKLENLVLQRMGDKAFANAVVKWASQVTALEVRNAGYDR